MPGITFSFSSDHRIQVFRLLLLNLIALSTFAFTHGQSLNQQPDKPPQEMRQGLLPAHFGAGWKASNESRSFPSKSYSVLPDADIYAEYGLQEIVTRDYTDGKTKYTVELFVMNYTSGAYGLLTFNRGEIKSNRPNRKEFQHGRYLISIFGASSITELDPTLVAAIKENLPKAEIGESSSLPSHLPEEGKVAGSERYLLGPLALTRTTGFGELKDVVTFTGGAEAVTASYSNGQGQMNLLIVEYHTPQLATDGFAKMQAHFDSLPQAEKEKRILRRIGNYAVETINVQDQASAQNVLEQIKYTQRVYWEGRKLSDIPIGFRPPDPAAIEEASQTANVLIRTFYWIGVMMTSALILGLIAGGSFFYIKRHLRRKRGLDNLFSDAGGTVRLDLDDYLLSPSNEPIKKIGKKIDKQIDEHDEEVET